MTGRRPAPRPPRLKTLVAGFAVVVSLAGCRGQPPAPAASTPGRHSPSASQIADVMGRTVEARDASEHFSMTGEAVIASDGEGGNFTAVPGTRSPTADAHGQVVFFWHNDRFVGLAAPFEVVGVSDVVPHGTAGFDVDYLQYAPSDPLCCPTMPTARVSYRWSGSSFEADAPLPTATYRAKIRVRTEAASAR